MAGAAVAPSLVSPALLYHCFFIFRSKPTSIFWVCGEDSIHVIIGKCADGIQSLPDLSPGSEIGVHADEVCRSDRVCLIRVTTVKQVNGEQRILTFAQ